MHYFIIRIQLFEDFIYLKIKSICNDIRSDKYVYDDL